MKTWRIVGSPVARDYVGYMQLVRGCNQYCRFCSNPATGYMLDLPTAQLTLNGLNILSPFSTPSGGSSRTSSRR